MNTHEEPTSELRQVRCYQDWPNRDQFYFKVQRKWIIHRTDDKGFIFTKGTREEWKDIPVVDIKDIQ